MNKNPVTSRPLQLLVAVLAAGAALLPSSPLQAQITVYDTQSLAAAAGYSEPAANNLILGDALNLSQGGQLEQLGFDLFNSSTGNTGSILAGTMNIRIYNNSVPYAGGSLAGTLPLLANLNFVVTFGAGLPAGSFSAIMTGSLAALNIVLPQNIFITQQFTQTAGTSTRWGSVLSATNSLVGNSPTNVYVNSAGTAEGLYTVGSGQFAFKVVVNQAAVPEAGSTIAMLMLGVSGLALAQRRLQRTR